jgi:decaprenyl-phosphate phosphoribosyltransferase
VIHIVTSMHLVKAMRPRQWMKNALVGLSPLMSGQMGDPLVLFRVLFAFVFFTMASAAIYLFNDIIDRKADSVHPKKRLRPVASGEVSVRLASFISVGLAVGSIVLPLSVGEKSFAGILIVYMVLQVLYCLWLKHTPLLDVAIISSGFLLRAIAGGVATGIPISHWFLLVAAFGSFFMASGKRYSEFKNAMGRDDIGSQKIGNTRAVLREYSESYLSTLLNISIAVMIGFYCLWSLEIAQVWTGLWAPLSVIPFVLAVLRYQYRVDRGEAESPEDVVLEDRFFIFFGSSWLLCVAIGIYVVPLVATMIG